MKKTLILAAVAVVAMASCAKNEVIAPSTSSAIGFDTFVGNSTKATEVTAFVEDNVMVVDAYYTDETNFESVTSAASLFMDDELVTRGADASWAYTNTAYWPKNETKKISFFAVADGTATRVDATSKTFNDLKGNNEVSFDYTNPATATDQKDLMVASKLNVTNTAKATGVKFAFAHILSQIKFTFKTSDFDTNASIELNEIKLTYDAGFTNVGTFTFKADTESAGTWDTTTSVTRQDEETFTAVQALSTTAKAYSALAPIMVIPQYKTITMYVKYTVTQKGSKIVSEYTSTLTPPAGGYLQAKIYTYAVNVGLDAIEFAEPSISNAWAADSNQGTVGSANYLTK